jgi:hypothetical protein
VAALNLPLVVQFTVIGSSRNLDAYTPRAADAAAQISALARKFGPRAVVWRYDPVVFTSMTPAAWHIRYFADLAGKLAGSVDECVNSAAQIYKKTERRLNIAAKTHEFAWQDPDRDEKRGGIEGTGGHSGWFGHRNHYLQSAGCPEGAGSGQVGSGALYRCGPATRLSPRGVDIYPTVLRR